MTNEVKKIYVSDKEAATALGLSVNTVRRLIAAGDIPYKQLSPRRIGNKVSDLENYEYVPAKVKRK